MIILEIDNSLSVLKNLTPAEFRLVKKSCTYKVQSKKKVRVKTKSGGFRWIYPVITRCLMDKKGVFPTGLLYRVKHLLKKKQWKYLEIDKRKKPELHTIKKTSLNPNRSYIPYPEQTEAKNTAIREERGIIAAPTGLGKSAICELICDELRVNTLIVVPTLNLKTQVTNSLRAAFGNDMVGPLGKSSICRFPISVENVDALDPTVILRDIDCVIIDEFHHSASNTYRKLNEKSWTKIYYKFGLTATPFRTKDSERLLLESVLSKVIYSIDYDQAVANGRIVPMEAYYIELEPRPETEEKGSRRKINTKDSANYAASYVTDVVKNEARNKIIVDMVSNLIEQHQSTLVLTKQIEHGQIIKDLLFEKGHQIEFAEGKNKLKSQYIDEFNSQELFALIGTVGVLGEGVDTKPAEWIILAGGGKSKIQFMQNCGRGFRRFGEKQSCKIIMFKDKSSKYQLKHFNACVAYLKDEYGIAPIKLDIP